MEKHFVTFYSPGTFVHETNTKEIDSWDVDQAIGMAKHIVQRYNARPFGFRFSTRGRGPEDLDSSETESSGMYYLGGKIETIEEIEARNDPSEEILRDNMRGNGWNRVLVNTNSWRWTRPLYDDDIVLDVYLGERQGEQS
jgi:hypothetical protein